MKERKNVQCASSAGSKRKMIKMDSENEMNRFFCNFFNFTSTRWVLTCYIQTLLFWILKIHQSPKRANCILPSRRPYTSNNNYHWWWWWFYCTYNKHSYTKCILLYLKMDKWLNVEWIETNREWVIIPTCITIE